MKVCLFSPPSITELRDPGVTEQQARAMMAENAPLGVLTLAAILIKQGITIDIIDMNRILYLYVQECKNNIEETDFCNYVSNNLIASNYDIFGFTTIWSSYSFTIRLAERLKQIYPDAGIIFGGPQASIVDLETLREYSYIDIIIRGEAEESFPIFLEAYKNKKFELIPGITYRKGVEIIRTPDATPIYDLDALPLPAYQLYPDLINGRHIPLELGRGCPFTCSFCSTNEFFSRKYRVKSPSRMLKDMKYLKSTYGIKRFDLIHDMFTADGKRVAEFCEALISSGENYEWNCSARTDCVNKDLIALMAEAGCKSIFFGVESGSNKLQLKINKKLELKEAEKQIHQSSNYGIQTTVSLIFGFPDETKTNLKKTINFLMESLRYDLADPQIHLLTPLNKTPLQVEYRDKLYLDDIYTDLSHSGWPQTLEDRVQILTHPDIFTSFYSLPLKYLNRKYLQELRLFILRSISSFRWLLVALYQDSNDFLNLFEDWLIWKDKIFQNRPSSDLDQVRFYLHENFVEEFLNFLKSKYLIHWKSETVSMMIKYTYILNYLTRRTDLENNEESTKKDLNLMKIYPYSKPGVVILDIEFDLNKIIEYIRRKKRINNIPIKKTILVTRRTGNCVDIMEVTPLLVRILQLCEGNKTVSEISNKISDESDSITGLTSETICLIAIKQLHNLGLVGYKDSKQIENQVKIKIISSESIVSNDLSIVLA